LLICNKKTALRREMGQEGNVAELHCWRRKHGKNGTGWLFRRNVKAQCHKATGGKMKGL